MHNLRHKHPHAGVNDFYIHARHRAEVDVHILKRLLHALADVCVCDRESRLPAHDQIDVRAGELDTAEKRDAKAARNMQCAPDNAVGTDAEIHGVLVLVCTAERAQLDCGIYGKDVKRLARQIECQLLRAAEVDAPVIHSVIGSFLPVEPEGITEAVDDLRIFPQPDDADIRCLEGNFTGSQNDVACTLNQMHIGTCQRTPQLDGRNGEVVAVHGFCQILEARAAAVELPDGNGRDKGDAGAGLDKEPQLVGNERAVLFAAFQRQRCLRFKEVEGVQLQLKGIALLTLEGVDLAADTGKLQRHQLCGVKAARGLYAVDLELVFGIQAVAQLFHRKLGAVEDRPEADVAAEHKVPRRVGSRVFQLHRGIGNVHKDDGIVLFGFDLERKAVLCERDLQIILRTAFRLVELEARRVQAYAAVLNRAVLFYDELSAVLIPCRCDGGREHRRAACKGKFRAVLALIVAADERNGVSVLLFQRFQRGIVRHMLHRHAAVHGERGKPLGIDGGIHRIRLGGDILRARLDQIMEAPKEVGVLLRVVGFFKCEAGITVTFHPGIQRLIARYYTDGLRQGGANRLSAAGGDVLFIVI